MMWHQSHSRAAPMSGERKYDTSIMTACGDVARNFGNSRSGERCWHCLIRWTIILVASATSRFGTRWLAAVQIELWNGQSYLFLVRCCCELSDTLSWAKTTVSLLRKGVIILQKRHMLCESNNIIAKLGRECWDWPGSPLQPTEEVFSATLNDCPAMWKGISARVTFVVEKPSWMFEGLDDGVKNGGQWRWEQLKEARIENIARYWS